MLGRVLGALKPNALPLGPNIVQAAGVPLLKCLIKGYISRLLNGKETWESDLNSVNVASDREIGPQTEPKITTENYLRSILKGDIHGDNPKEYGELVQILNERAIPHRWTVPAHVYPSTPLLVLRSCIYQLRIRGVSAGRDPDGSANQGDNLVVSRYLPYNWLRPKPRGSELVEVTPFFKGDLECGTRPQIPYI